MEPLDPISVIGWMHEYGVSLVLLALVTVLLFAYFWRLVNAKPEHVRLFDSINHLIEKLVTEIQCIKISVAEVKTMLNGEFRNRGSRNG